MRFIAAAALFLLACLSCGDGLSSLEAVQRTARSEFDMYLSSDYGRQGDDLVVTVTFCEELNKLLRAADVYFPTDISFGDGIQITTFGRVGEVSLEVGLLISPLAETGERHPALVFSLGNRRVVARGLFFVLPALPGD